MSSTSSIRTKHSELIAHLSGKNGPATRRPIRILHNSAILPNNHEVFQQLQETNAVLEERLASLKTLRSHTKQTNTANLLKGEWTDENTRLTGLRHKLENAIKSYLQLVILNSNQLNANAAMLSTTANNALPGFGNIGKVTTKLMKTGVGNSTTNVQAGNDNQHGAITPESRQDITFIINFIDSMIYEEEKLSSERLTLRSTYQTQLKDIKRIISNAQKSISSSGSKSISGNNSSKVNDDNTSSQLPQQTVMIRGVIADMFLNLRCDHSKTWQSLRQQEDELKSQLNAFDKQINDMLKTETLQKQDEYLESELVKLLKECTALNQSGAEITRYFTDSPQITPRSPRKANSPRFKNSSKPITEGSTVIALNDTNGEKSTKHEFAPVLQNLIFPNKSDNELASILQTDPELVSVLHSFLQQIQQVDHELVRLKEQSSLEVSQLHMDLEMDPSVPYGGWNQDSHETFLKIYRKATLTGMQRKKMMEVLANALPDESRDSIMAHEEYVRGMKRISSKYKQMEQTQIVKRQELMVQVAKEVQDYNQDKAEKIKYEQQLQQHEEKRMMIHERLESMRQEKILHDEEKRMEELLKAQEEDKQSLLRLQQLEAERQERNKKLTEYREQKRKLLEQQNMQLEMERMRMAEELKKMIEENRSKVELRAHKIEEKNLQRKLKEVRFFSMVLPHWFLFLFFYGFL